LPVFAARFDELRGVLVRQSKVQTKATSLVKIFGNRGRDEALELIDVEVEGFGIASLASLFGGGPEIRRA
jgi:hypothetical protein